MGDQVEFDINRFSTEQCRKIVQDYSNKNEVWVEVTGFGKVHIENFKRRLVEVENFRRLNEAYKLIQEVLLTSSEPNMTKTYVDKEKDSLYKLLDTESLYLVEVKWNPSNIEHKAVLFTGHKSGSYWEVYNSSYREVGEFRKLHSIKVINKLGEVK